MYKTRLPRIEDANPYKRLFSDYRYRHQFGKLNVTLVKGILTLLSQLVWIFPRLGTYISVSSTTLVCFSALQAIFCNPNVQEHAARKDIVQSVGLFVSAAVALFSCSIDAASCNTLANNSIGCDGAILNGTAVSDTPFEGLIQHICGIIISISMLLGILANLVILALKAKQLKTKFKWITLTSQLHETQVSKKDLEVSILGRHLQEEADAR